MITFLSKNGPDGRNKILTFFFVSTIPLIVSLILTSIILEDAQTIGANLPSITALIATCIFGTLYGYAVMKDTYMNPLSEASMPLFRFASWGLLYVLMFPLSLIADRELQTIIGFSASPVIMYLFNLVLSVLLYMYGYHNQKRTKTHYTPTPLSILNEAVSGLISYIIVLIILGLVISFKAQ